MIFGSLLLSATRSQRILRENLRKIKAEYCTEAATYGCKILQLYEYEMTEYEY